MADLGHLSGSVANTALEAQAFVRPSTQSAFLEHDRVPSTGDLVLTGIQNPCPLVVDIQVEGQTDCKETSEPM